VSDNHNDTTPEGPNAGPAPVEEAKGTDADTAERENTDGKNIVHFNPWRDFNDAAPQVDVFGDEPDAAQIATFMGVVFGYCDGLIPVRSFIDKGQGIDGRPHNIWLEANGETPDKMATFANWASREGAAVYVIPGSVAEAGQAKAADVLQMQALVVDLDTGDIAAKRAHLEAHLGAPTMVVQSGGITPEGQQKCHIWWKLTEPAEGSDVARACRIRGDIAAKVGGDMHFSSAHQPIRVAGSVYYKNNLKTLVQILEINPGMERDLDEFTEAVADMPPAPGISLEPEFVRADKPQTRDVLPTPVREGAQDDWSRFEGASAAIGHFVRMVHEGRMSKDAGSSRYDGGGMRYLRFQNWLAEMDRLSGPIATIWYEEVRRHAGTDAAHVFRGLMATLKAWAEMGGVPYQGVPVGTIKRFATGKGNANKSAMMVAAQKRGFSPADDNEADAIAILLWAFETKGGVA